MCSYTVTQADVMEFQSYKRYHAMLCDPPYHLTSIVKRFGNADSAPAKPGPFRRVSKGFMGQEWDGGDVAFRVETWEYLKQFLFPGAFCMAFASSRGWHRLAVAIEDAGFIIHPTIFCWLNSQGFPKATRIDNQIDRQSGADELVKAWEGHRYGAQALKPAVEPIIVFQNPYDGRPLDNITNSGAGALNIDATRIPGEEYTINTWDDDAHPFGDGAGNDYTSRTENGRWPSNFILDESLADNLDQQAGVRKSGMRKKDYQIGEDGVHKNYGVYGEYKSGQYNSESDGWEGGASEFYYNVSSKIDESDPVYYCPKAGPDERTNGLSIFLVKEIEKESIWKKENEVLEQLLQKVISELVTNLSIDVYGEKITVRCRRECFSTTRTEISKITESVILNWLTQEHTTDSTEAARSSMGSGGSLAGDASNSSCLTEATGILTEKTGLNMEGAARAIYVTLCKVAEGEGWKELRSFHPTHKPIDLTRYLATMLLPPDMYAPRSILVPFAGVGSEMIGAIQAGWEEVDGVELHENYVELAKMRLGYYASLPVQKKLF